MKSDNLQPTDSIQFKVPNQQAVDITLRATYQMKPKGLNDFISQDIAIVSKKLTLESISECNVD